MSLLTRSFSQDADVRLDARREWVSPSIQQRAKTPLQTFDGPSENVSYADMFDLAAMNSLEALNRAHMTSDAHPILPNPNLDSVRIRTRE